ncbi:MAG: prepilin-type N-terminal cleavage/methylation domain-containing protein, partial [Betaproteobacteria bacterium]
MLKRGTAKRGFTLIEILISITVLGIILMLGLPSFASWLQNQQLRAASEGLLNGLQTARAEAIRRNLLVQIVVAPPGTGWSVSEAVSAAAIQTRVKEEGSPNAVLTVTPNPATTLTFTSLGSVAANLDGSPTPTQFKISNPAGGTCQPAGPMRCLLTRSLAYRTHEDAKDAKRHAYSLSGAQAPGRRHAARSADRHPYFLHRHSCRRRHASHDNQERHRLQASHRGGVPHQQAAVADVDRCRKHRLVRVSRERRCPEPPYWLGRPGHREPSRRGGEPAGRHDHGRRRDGRQGDHPSELAAAGGSDEIAAATQLHRRRLGLHELSMRALIARRHARGFSMVELMVAMVISLIGVIIIFQVFEASEGVRRTTMSGGDAQQNGAVALYLMERDLRNSGMGINDTIYAGCNIVGYDSSRTTPNFPPAGSPMILA